jgi:prepilin-type N-terminal cleavage/methylation domain-containing protein
MKTQPVRAFTLVELLVVIAIIGVLVAMTIPAIQASREMGHRSLCQARLAQLLLAMQTYDNAFESLPAGVLNPDGPIRSEAQGLHQSWMIRLLPYLDEGNAYRLIDFDKSVYDPANVPVRQHWPSVFICPSEPDDLPGASNYAGCHHDVEAPIAADNHGVLFLNSHVRREDITDGVSHTFFLGEKRSEVGDLGWMSGTRATLRNTGLPPNTPSASAAAPADDASDKLANLPESPTKSLTYVGGFASGHVGGVYMGLGDCGVKFISDMIDLKVWQQLGNRADGKLLNFDLAD